MSGLAEETERTVLNPVSRRPSEHRWPQSRSLGSPSASIQSMEVMSEEPDAERAGGWTAKAPRSGETAAGSARPKDGFFVRARLAPAVLIAFVVAFVGGMVALGVYLTQSTPAGKSQKSACKHGSLCSVALPNATTAASLIGYLGFESWGQEGVVGSVGVGVDGEVEAQDAFSSCPPPPLVPDMAAGGLQVKVHVDDGAGRASLMVPLPMPRGTGSIELKGAGVMIDSLTSANGPLGLGSSLQGLGSSGISRGRKTLEVDGIAQAVQWNANDTFYAGSTALVLVNEEDADEAIWDGTLYRPAVDNGVMYRFFGRKDEGGPRCIQAREPGGIVQRYGCDPQSRVPGVNGVTAMWLTTQMTQATEAGLAPGVSFSYSMEDWGSNTYEPLLQQITYAGEDGQAVRVNMVYEPRPDPYRHTVAGMHIVNSQRVQRIEVAGRPANATSPSAARVPVSNFLFEYGVSTSSGASLLTSITQCDGCSQVCLAPAVIQWTQSGATSEAALIVPTNIDPEATPATYDVGSGNADLFRLLELATYTESSWFSSHTTTYIKSEKPYLGHSTQRMYADMNMDGCADVTAAHSSSTSGVVLLTSLANCSGIAGAPLLGAPVAQTLVDAATMGTIEDCSNAMWSFMNLNGTCGFSDETDGNVLRVPLLGDLDSDGNQDLVWVYVTAETVSGGDVSPGVFVLAFQGTGANTFSTTPTFSYLASTAQIATSSPVADKCSAQLTPMGIDRRLGVTVLCGDYSLGGTVLFAAQTPGAPFTFGQAVAQPLLNRQFQPGEWSLFTQSVYGAEQPDVIGVYVGEVGVTVVTMAVNGIPTVVDGATTGIAFGTPNIQVLDASDFARGRNWTVTVTDADRDGAVDIIGSVADSKGWSAMRALGNSDGTFSPVTRFTLSTDKFSDSGDASASWASSFIDINNDGMMDHMAILTSGGSGGYEVYTSLATADGMTYTAATKSLLSNQMPTADPSWDVLEPMMVDLKGTGKPVFGVIKTHFQSDPGDAFYTTAYVLDSAPRYPLDQVAEISTGLGHPTTITYALLSNKTANVYKYEGAAASRPSTASSTWAPAAPSPRYVVQSVTDPIGMATGPSKAPAVVHYRYGLGGTDVARGVSLFAQVNASVPTTRHLTVKDFSADSIDKMAGRVIRERLFRHDPTTSNLILYRDTATSYTAVRWQDSKVTPELPNVGAIVWVRRDSDLMLTYDWATGAPLANVSHSFGYDANGTMTTSVEVEEDATLRKVTENILDVYNTVSKTGDVILGLPYRGTVVRKRCEIGINVAKAYDGMMGDEIDSMWGESGVEFVEEDGCVWQVSTVVTERVFDNHTGLVIHETKRAGTNFSITSTTIRDPVTALPIRVESLGADESQPRVQELSYDVSWRYRTASCEEAAPDGYTSKRCTHWEFDAIGNAVGMITSAGLRQNSTYDGLRRRISHCDVFGACTYTTPRWCAGAMPSSISQPQYGYADCTGRDGAVVAVEQSSTMGPTSVSFLDSGSRTLEQARSLQLLGSEEAELVEEFTHTDFDMFSKPNLKTLPYLESDRHRVQKVTTRDDMGLVVANEAQLLHQALNGSMILRERRTQAITYAGETITVTNPADQTVSHVRNVLGETPEITDNLGRRLRFVRDPNGNVVMIGVIVEDGGADIPLVRASYDAGGNRRATWTADRGRSFYSHSSRNMLVKQQLDETNDVLERDLDSLDRVVEERSSDGRVCVYEYDPIFVEKASSITCNGGDGSMVKDEYLFNAHGAIALHKRSIQSGKPSHHFDALANAQYEELLARGVGESAARKRVYSSSAGWAKTTSGDADESCYVSGAVGFVYDNYGRVMEQRYAPTGACFRMHYHHDNAMFVGASTCDTNTTLFQVTSFDARGRPLTIRHGVDGVNETVEYDPFTGAAVRIAVTSIDHTTGEPVLGVDRRIALDVIGRVVERSDAIRGLTETIGYDGANRLTSAIATNSDGATLYSDLYTYDSFGNRVSGPNTPTLTYNTTGPLHAATTVERNDATLLALVRDAGSRVVAYNSTLVAYDSASRAAAVARGAVLKVNAFDGSGNAAFEASYLRIADKKSSSSPSLSLFTTTAALPGGVTATTAFDTVRNRTQTTYMHSVGGRAVYVVEATETKKVKGEEECPTANRVNAFTLHLHKDAQHSVVAVSKGGNIVGEYAYDPFGMPRNVETWEREVALQKNAPALASNNVISGVEARARAAILIPQNATATAIQHRGFAGHGSSVALGRDVMVMNGRLYFADIGSFASPDSFIEQKGATVEGYNGFAYAAHNPLLGFDPSGRSFFGSLFGGIADFFKGVFDAIKDVVHAISSLLTKIPLLNLAVTALMDFELGPFSFIWSFADSLLTGHSLTQALEAMIPGALGFLGSEIGGLGAAGGLGKLFQSALRPGTWMNLGLDVVKGAVTSAMNHQNILQGALLGAVDWVGSATFAAIDSMPAVSVGGDLLRVGAYRVSLVVNGILGKFAEGFIDGAGAALIGGDSLGAALKAGFEGGVSQAASEFVSEMKEVATVAYSLYQKYSAPNPEYSKLNDPNWVASHEIYSHWLSFKQWGMGKLASAGEDLALDGLHASGPLSGAINIVIDARDITTASGMQPHLKATANVFGFPVYQVMTTPPSSPFGQQTITNGFTPQAKELALKTAFKIGMSLLE